MIRVILSLLMLGTPAQAETARVLSGEHADFTRLVVELSGGGAWTVGKTPMGYAFAVPGKDQPIYDLGSVWDRIPRTRLQALRTDAATGALLLTLACRCHVFPFEYRPGVIVLDIKDGPAPAGSAFEEAFDGVQASRSFGPPVLPQSGGSVSGYSWIAARGMDARSASREIIEGLAFPAIGRGNGLGPLRDQLLRQISASAASGIVDMALPDPAPKMDPAKASVPWAQVRIGELPGVTARTTSPDEENLPPAEACTADELLDLAGWGKAVQPADLVSTARAGLYGEFDRLDPEAVTGAVRQHLFLGFGVEARQYAALLGDRPEDEPLRILVALSHLVDGDPDPSGIFSTMMACEGRAALWALLAADQASIGTMVATDAVLRGFLELPVHLRRSLGPGLAERFMYLDDMEAVRIIRDALDRQADPATATVAMIDAKVDLLAGRGEDARLHAEAALAESIDPQSGLAALVEAHFQDMRPLSPDVATGLAAFLAEAESPDDERDLQRVLVLALALSDQTAAAFDLSDTTGLPTDDLWAVTVARAGDDAFLTEAVDVAADRRRQTSDNVAFAVAVRLANLGFPDAALDWLGPIDADAPSQRRRLAAQAHLDQGAASVALDLLAGLSAAEDELLRARAFVQLGRYEPAREAYLSAGLPEEADRLVPWMADWSGLPAEGAEPWRAVAGELGSGPSAEDAGPLSRGRTAAENSAATRAAIRNLLQAVEGPSG
jgi:hypothetical protein